MHLGRSDQSGQLQVRQFTPGIRMHLHMCLERPLLIGFHFPTLYANKCRTYIISACKDQILMSCMGQIFQTCPPLQLHSTLPELTCYLHLRCGPTPTCYYKSYNLCRWIRTQATQSFPSKRFIFPCTAGWQAYAKWMSNNILKYKLVYLKLWYSFKTVI